MLRDSAGSRCESVQQLLRAAYVDVSCHQAFAGSGRTKGLAFPPPRPDLATRNFLPLVQIATSGTQTIEGWIGADRNFDAFDLTAIMARLTNNLRKLTFMNTGRGG